ncbi:MAG: hypothetical protein MMC33_005139 [Icmadophila ericetorum]|nr:hypothetical protein [Icmadophila ericetorum]
MEELGPEMVKRPRLESYGGASSSRMQHIQQQVPEASSHAYSGPALHPPPAYHHPLPPSPYHDSANEHRSLPEPSPHNYAPGHSGYTTPIRDTRCYPPEPTYSRHGSASAPTRSPDDVQQLAQLRPLNTAIANEVHHYQQPSHPEVLRPPTGYMNHESHSDLNTTTHSMQNHNDQTPVSVQTPISGYPTTSAGSELPLYGPGGSFNASQNSAWINRQTRKNTRATQACDTCRTRKAKCDEGKPVCGYCHEQNLSCNYKEVAPAKADRAQKEIMDRLKMTEEKVDKLQSTIEKFMESLSSKQSPPSKPQDTDLMRIPKHNDPDDMEQKPDGSSSDSGSFNHNNNVTAMQERRQPQHAISSISHVIEPTTSVEGSGAIYHTTAAHRLLRWPTIQKLLKERVGEDYVMELEEKKGTLRIYGRGCGKDTLDDIQTGPSSPATSSLSGRSDDMSKSPALTPQVLWGTGGFAPPNMSDNKWWGRSGDHPGGLDADGSLKMDSATMFHLFDSYMLNIHILHPFLDKNRLQRMFERVAHRNHPSNPSNRPSPYQSHGILGPDSLGNSPGLLHHSNKRKASSGIAGGSAADDNIPVNQPLERRISTAIILLVMALGKICDHPEPLPGPIPDGPKETPSSVPRSFSPYPRDSPPIANMKPSPSSSSTSGYAPPAFSPTSEARSSSNTHMISRRPSEEQGSPYAPQKFTNFKNVDVIPGLAYFAYATDILGNQHGALDLPHIQAHLLAGLYMGQLACTFESWSWIRTACNVCHYVIRDPKLTKERDEARKDSIRFAYYTCLQLESDILAELDLRRSGIDRAEYSDIVDYPKGVTEDVTGLVDLNKPEARMLFHYSSQINLRTMLNRIQMTLYPPGNQTRIPLSTRDQCEDMLTQWRQVLPEPMRWRDGDPPSADINEARLRAKYYGALYIIHRPFLHYALHSPEFRTMPENPDSPSYAPRADHKNGTMPPPTLTQLDKFQILRSARTCVEAAIHSTIAFDGVCFNKRLIVTNIFGTAHAQFGNMLVLSAVYRSQLGYLVDQAKVVNLLERTINFLHRLKNISETLHTDAKILENVLQVVKNEDSATASSFSSN